MKPQSRKTQKEEMTMNAVAKAEPRAVKETSAPERDYQAPRVDITESKEGYVLTADMPGVTKDGLEVLLEKNELTIVGRTTAGSPNLTPLYRETANRDFRRVFVLDPDIDAAKVGAHLDDGVLTLSLPKAERVRPRKITITG